MADRHDTDDVVLLDPAALDGAEHGQEREEAVRRRRDDEVEPPDPRRPRRDPARPSVGARRKRFDTAPEEAPDIRAPERHATGHRAPARNPLTQDESLQDH